MFLANQLNSVNFASKYSMDANQKMKDYSACYLRDYYLGITIGQAKNSDDLKSQCDKFFKGEYEAHPTAPCMLKIDLPDSADKQFETSMNSVGQRFQKVC